MIGVIASGRQRGVMALQLVLAVGLAATPCWAASADLRLLEAVRRRDEKAFTALLKQVDVNASQPDGATALAWAANLGEDAMATALIAAGANVNAEDEYGETPITLAAANGDTALVERLLAAGASARSARWNGETAVMIAAGAGSAASVKALVARGADVNAADPRRRQTPLMWAAAEGHAEAAAALIAAGAPVSPISKGGFNALAFAVAKGDAATVKTLLAAGADPNFRLSSGNTMLLMAIGYRHLDVASALMASGADIHAVDRDQNSPLHVAARIGDVDLVKKLLAGGINPNVRTATTAVAKFTDNRGARGFVGGALTPLLVAARYNRLNVMRALVEAGADPTIQADNGTTLLMAGSGAGFDVVQYAYELDPHAVVTNRIGQTPMHLALVGDIQRPEPEIMRVVQFLIDKGAKLDEADSAGQTPLRFAEPQGFDKVADLLVSLIVKSGATPKVPPKH
ncbi:MAG: ankyrin repeat domain-containing protein [Acidobacteriota bacterium]